MKKGRKVCYLSYIMFLQFNERVEQVPCRAQNPLCQYSSVSMQRCLLSNPQPVIFPPFTANEHLSTAAVHHYLFINLDFYHEVLFIYKESIWVDVYRFPAWRNRFLVSVNVYKYGLGTWSFLCTFRLVVFKLPRGGAARQMTIPAVKLWFESPSIPPATLLPVQRCRMTRRKVVSWGVGVGWGGGGGGVGVSRRLLVHFLQSRIKYFCTLAKYLLTL